MPRGMPPTAMRPETDRLSTSITEMSFDSQFETKAVFSSGDTVITLGQHPPVENEARCARSDRRNTCAMVVVICVTHSSPRPGSTAISTKPSCAAQGAGGCRVCSTARPSRPITSTPCPSSRAQKSSFPSGAKARLFGWRPVPTLPSLTEPGCLALELQLQAGSGREGHEEGLPDVPLRGEHEHVLARSRA